jgi:hypothetical protein
MYVPLYSFFIATFIGCAHSAVFGSAYRHNVNDSAKINNIARYVINKTTVVLLSLHAVTDHNFNKQFQRSKLARGAAVSSKCNSRCSAKIDCNKRCQLARDKYQLKLAKDTYKKNNVKKYTTSQINQRYYSGQVEKGECNSRCQAAKSRYQKERIQYMKIFHEPCQNGHIKNTGTLNGKPLSDQGNPSGDTPGDKTTVGGYRKGRPLGPPGAGQINWPNSAKYNWRTACKSYDNQGKAMQGKTTHSKIIQSKETKNNNTEKSNTNSDKIKPSFAYSGIQNMMFIFQ